MAGVTLFGVRDGRIVWGRLYMEPVEEDGEDIDEAVQSITERGKSEQERTARCKQATKRIRMSAVIGATGIVGGMITRQLLEQGKEVCILVRHDSPSEQLPLRLATGRTSENSSSPHLGE
jgi:hypothetical protein